MGQAQTKCPKCGTTYPSGHQMCVRCGTRLPGSTPGVAVGSGAGQKPAWGFQRGQVVANRYTVIDMIGRGGMGCIYKVRDNTLEEDVALKTLLPKFTNDQHVVDRFFNEARIARQLSHPNIIRVHDIGMAGTVVYISMEFIKGRSLREWIDSIPAGQRMPIAYALRLMIQLCAALEFAHKFTVHRDLKPENIMITAEGQMKLMDFGISKLKSNVQLTSAQMVMGTPKYMSPEQLKDSSTVDHRSDIYALGAILYELLTGSVPTGLAQQPSQIRNETPPALDAIVSKCLALDPKDRYQSAGELRAELQPLLQTVEKSTGIEIPEFEIPVPRRVSSGFPFRKLFGALLILFLLAAVAFGVWRLETLTGGDKSATPGEPGNPALSQVDGFASAFENMTAHMTRARDEAVILTERESERKARLEEDLAAEEADDGEEGASERVAELKRKLQSIRITYLSEGDAFRAAAEAMAAQRDPEAFRAAWHAIACYLGPVICPDDMVFVPPGETVVAPGSEPVFVDGFFIERYEVSNAQFLRFTLAGKWPAPDYLANGLDDALREYPVVSVTLYDALACAAERDPAPWGKRTLPTEAQWARAAYGGPNAPRAYPWGQEWDPNAVSAAGDGDGFVGAAPKGAFELDRSPFGCYDVAGNVMEWTRSIFVDPYDRAAADVPPDALWFGSTLAVRGGCYEDAQVPLSRRWGAAFDEASPLTGFRCALPFPTGLADLDAALQAAIP